jgi:hypothetical protein
MDILPAAKNRFATNLLLTRFNSFNASLIILFGYYLVKAIGSGEG